MSTTWYTNNLYGNDLISGEHSTVRRTLNDVVSFDTPFTVATTDHGAVSVLDYDESAPHTPDVEHDPTGDVSVSDARWEALTGFTGQYSYNGAVMHPSEFLGGGLARHVLTNPGTYVVVEVRDDNGEFPEGDPVGWAVLQLKS